jgi:tetratricopeptide (TPR) repeat protein
MGRAGAVVARPDDASRVARRDDGARGRAKEAARRGRADLEQAHSLNPSDPLVLYNQGVLLATLGLMGDAIATERKATELDPLNPQFWYALGKLYRDSGQFRLARIVTNRAMEIAPDFVWGTWSLGTISLLEGDSAAALSAFGKCPIEIFRLTGAALVDHDPSHLAESRAALEALVAKYSDVAAYQIAEIYAWRGDATHAFEWLDRAYSKRDSAIAWVKHDALLRKVRGTEAYDRFLRKLKLPAN